MNIYQNGYEKKVNKKDYLNELNESLWAALRLTDIKWI